MINLYKVLFVIITLSSSCSKLIPLTEVPKENNPVSGTEINVMMFRDSTSSDHKMIQMAIDYAANNNYTGVFVPDGEYNIDAAGVNGEMGILLKDNLHLRLADNAILKAIPNNVGTYYILRAHNVQNLKISGGKIIGERTTHSGTTGEWGMGIDLRNTRNVKIENVYVADCWGDGIYIGKGSNYNVQIKSVICDNNRRQGMSITSADSILVVNSKFKNTNGTAPQAGIDLEPNTGNLVTNVEIFNCEFSNNLGRGFDIVGLTGTISYVTIDSCRFSNNNTGISISHAANNISITNVDIKKSINYGFSMAGGPKDIKLLNSKIDSCQIGIKGRAIENVRIEGNDIKNYSVEGMYIYENSKSIKIINNTLQTNVAAAWGIRSGTSSFLEITDCKIKGGQVGISSGYDDNLSITRTKVSNISEYPVKFFQTKNSSLVDSSIDTCVSKHAVLLQYANFNVISNNVFRGNSFITNNMYSYILLEATSNNNQCNANNILSSVLASKSQYGIWLKSGTHTNVISLNTIDASSYGTASILNQGTGNTVN